MDSPTDCTDDELISRCRKQDAGAWEILIRRYQRLISSITSRFRLTPDDSADVFQAVCFALFEQIPELRKGGKLSSWLITVTLRECWKLRQRSGRTLTFDDSAWEKILSGPDKEVPSFEGELLRIERQYQVRRAFDDLSAKCRELLGHLFFASEPLSYASLSKEVDMPVASIGPTRGRCLERMKSSLELSGFRE